MRFFIHGHKMIAGHATVGLEIIEDLPEVQAVFIPVGGGALIAGVGSAVKARKSSVRIVGVQTESYPSLLASFQASNTCLDRPETDYMR